MPNRWLGTKYCLVTETEPISTVGAFLRLETEKRGCELSVNTFRHLLRLAELGIALILNARTYVSDRYQTTSERHCIYLLIVLRTGTVERTPKTSDVLIDIFLRPTEIAN